MNITNGKLLGQTKSDLDILQEKIDLRCDRLETFLSKEQQEQIQFYKTGLEKVYYLQQTLGQQIKDLENNQLNYSDKSLLTNKHQISKKMMCFTLSTSLIMSITAVFSSLKGSTEYQCQSSLEPSKTSIIQSQN